MSEYLNLISLIALFIAGIIVSIMAWSIKQNISNIKNDISDIKDDLDKLTENNNIAHTKIHEKSNKLAERVAVCETLVIDIKNNRR